jgi:hypothetical protein
MDREGEMVIGTYGMKWAVILLAGVLFLTFSWVTLFWCFDEFVLLPLVPYDNVILDERPAPGSWQRQLNDFFEKSPARHLPAWFLTAMSVVFFVTTWRHVSKSPFKSIKLELIFALSNFFLIAAVFVSSFVVGSILPELPNAVYGRYGWTYRFIVAHTLLVGFWLTFQAWGIPKWLLACTPHEAAS